MRAPHSAARGTGPSSSSAALFDIDIDDLLARNAELRQSVAQLIDAARAVRDESKRLRAASASLRNGSGGISVQSED